jgi:hypothetical protein
MRLQATFNPVIDGCWCTVRMVHSVQYADIGMRVGVLKDKPSV